MSHRALSGEQFVTQITKHPSGARVFSRTHGGREMANMILEPTHRDGVPREEGYAAAPKDALAVEGIEVHPEYQGQGHASSMWHMAQKLRLNVVHSVDRTEAGDEWAKKVGGYSPPLPTRVNRHGETVPAYAEYYGEWDQ